MYAISANLQTTNHSKASLSRVSVNTKLEMLRRLKREQVDVIEGRLRELNNVDFFVSQLIASMQGGGWEKSPILNAVEMPDYALIAFQEKALSSVQFATLMQYWAIAKAHQKKDITTISLGMAARAKLVNMFDNQDVQVEDFSRELDRFPESEKRFFIVPQDTQNEHLKISHLINQSMNNVFGKIKGGEKIMRMVPSCGVYIAFLRAKFGTKAVEINPVLGFSSLKDTMINGENGTRDMAFHFPGVTLPQEADYMLAPWYDFTHHDFYHTYIVSAIPHGHRRVMIALAKLFQKYLQEKFGEEILLKQHLSQSNCKLVAEYAQESSERTVRFICTALIDMEHPAYMENSAHLEKRSLDDKLWITLKVIFFDRIPAHNHVVVAGMKKPMIPFEPLNAAMQEMLTLRVVEWLRKEKEQTITEPPSTSLREKGFLPLDPNIRQDILSANPLFFQRVAQLWEENFYLTPTLLRIIEEIGAIQDAEKLNVFIHEKCAFLFHRSTIFGLLQASLAHRCTPLTQACMVFIMDHVPEMVGTRKFIQFTQEFAEHWTSILRGLRTSTYFRRAFKKALITPGSSLLSLLMPSAQEVNLLDGFGFSPLDYAIRFRRKDVAEDLLRLGAHPNPQPRSKAMPSAFAAIRTGDFKLMILLIKQGFAKTHRWMDQNLLEYIQVQMQDPLTFGMWAEKYVKGKLDLKRWGPQDRYFKGIAESMGVAKNKAYQSIDSPEFQEAVQVLCSLDAPQTQHLRSLPPHKLLATLNVFALSIQRFDDD